LSPPPTPPPTHPSVAERREGLSSLLVSLGLLFCSGPPPEESVGAPDRMTVSHHSKSEGWPSSPISPPPSSLFCNLHCNENPTYVFLFWEKRGLSPNFHIHVSVSDFYSPRIGLHISSSRIGRPVVGIYKSLTDA
jgi:hypothetical protein